MTQLYIHIGPFKTGTTSFQNFMWNNKDAFLEKGVLYPQSGINLKGLGKRHLSLARSPKAAAEKQKVDEAYADLVKEIESHPKASKVVISAERFSQRMNALVNRKDIIAPYNPKLVVVIRDEVAMSRSMYFQIAQSRFRYKNELQGKGLKKFGKWFKGYKANFSYPKMLKPWIDTFGIDSVIFVPFEAHRNKNIITSLTEAMDLPEVEAKEMARKDNPSIGWLATASAITASKGGPDAAKKALAFATKLEKRFPEFKKLLPKGYDAAAMRAYYDAENAPAFEKYPTYKAAHDAACLRD